MPHGLCNLRSTVSQQDTFVSKPSPMESILTTVNPRNTERDALIRAFERLESQLDRLEGQVHKIESHFHQLSLRLVGNHGDLLKLLIQNLERLDGIGARLGSGEPQRPQKRPRRDASKQRKAA
jgi:hypothetical protein